MDQIQILLQASREDSHPLPQTSTLHHTNKTDEDWDEHEAPPFFLEIKAPTLWHGSRDGEDARSMSAVPSIVATSTATDFRSSKVQCDPPPIMCRDGEGKGGKERTKYRSGAENYCWSDGDLSNNSVRKKKLWKRKKDRFVAVCVHTTNSTYHTSLILSIIIDVIFSHLVVHE
jgi:hypothetical protein